MLEALQPILKFFKPEHLVQGGYVLMTLIVFTETGLLIGFCLPGDSLLVTAGLFASQGHLNILLLNLFLVPAAIIGDTVGYWIGYHTGPKLFNREKSFLFNPAHLREAHEFYERHGGKTIVLARFVPIVRTFAPVVAGMGKMDYKHFLMYNVFGGLGWVTGMTLTGYYLGRIFPSAMKRLEMIIVVVVFVSILPGLVPIVRNRLRKRSAVAPPLDQAHAVPTRQDA